MNRLRFILLFAVVLLADSAAAYDFESGGLYYNILDSEAMTVEVTSSGGERYSGDIVIPGKVLYNGLTYYVKAVGERSFYDISLKSVTIEDGVETVGDYAFWDSDGIYELELPSTLKTIGNYAFTWAYIKTLVLPEGLTSIGQSAFTYCNNMQKLVLPSTLTSIGNEAFCYCGVLSDVISHIQTPFSVSGVFNGDYSSTNLFVPTGTKSEYETTSGWNVFGGGIHEGEPLEYTADDGLVYRYTTDGNEAKVVAGDYSEITSVTIPGSVTISGSVYAVKSVGSGAFANCQNLKTLVLEEGVETIEKKAFSSCWPLKTIQFPSTLKTISDEAFSNCSSGPDIVLPEGLESVGSNAFSWSNSNKVIIPSTLKTLGDYAFTHVNNSGYVVSRIKEPYEIGKHVFAYEWNWDNNEETITYSQARLYVPAGTKDIYQATDGWNVFSSIEEGEPKEAEVDGIRYSFMDGSNVAKVVSGNYSEMTSVTIPGTVTINGSMLIVTEVGDNAFNGCHRLDSLVIENGVEVIGENAFRACYDLKTIQLPTSLRTIKAWAFYDCCNYSTDIILPEGLEVIENDAFNWVHSSLVELPSTLKSIGERAFYNMSYNVKVKSNIKEPFAINVNTFAYDSYWQDDKQIFTPHEGTLHVPVGTLEKYQAIAGWQMIGDIMEGEPIEGLGDDGFNYSYVPETKKATLIKGDTNYRADVTIPANTTIGGITYKVIGIGANAFQNSNSLRTLKIEEGVETIGNGAFAWCYSLRSALLPQSITKIGSQAFEQCNMLDTVAIPSSVKSIGDNAFWATKIKDVVIPATTTNIGSSAFAYCEQIKSISVDANNSYYDSRNNCNAIIEKASNKLLRGCGNTVIPNSVVAIGDHAFSGCSNLTNASIPNSVTSIEYGAFFNCNALSTVIIPSSVSYIAPECFGGCSSLESLRVDPYNTVYDSRNDCNAVIETKTNKLVLACKNTFVPRGVKIIGDAAFRNISGMDSLKIPYGVETIETRAISYNSIQYLEIPNSVRSIDYYAFEGCYNLSTFVSKIKEPSEASINNGAFWNSNVQSTATLYVPKGKKEAYLNVGNAWSNFENIEEMDGDPAPTPTLSYDGRSVTATCSDKEVDMYYSTDGSEPSNYYEGPIAVHDLGTVKVIAEKSFAVDSEVAEYNVEYLYDGETLKLSRAGLMADAIAWCGADKVEKMTVVGPISTSEFETIRSLSNLQFLNLAGATSETALTIPDNAFANTSLVSFVAPTTIGSVGSSIFSGCTQLAAVCWDNTDKPLPADALTGVDNPNLLLYVSKTATAPEGIRNVITGGEAKKIYLSDTTGNSNFYCPVAFHVDTIYYTRNFRQKTEVGVSCGWETIALPFSVQSYSHENLDSRYYTIVPFANYWSGNDNQRPFWLYSLQNNNIEPASSIEANVPYLICMPNADEYGDQYNLAGNVTFMATKVEIEESKPIETTQYDVSFVPTYQCKTASADIFALNVSEEYKGYPAGSLFVNNFREVRPFEAYSVHPSQAKAAGARMITVSSLIGGGDDTTGIIDMMLKKNDGTSDADAVIKVYSLSGALVKQGRADEVTKSLPKGIYIANGKKFVVK